MRFYKNTPLKDQSQRLFEYLWLSAVLQFYCKFRLLGCARRPQHRETSIAFFSDSPLTEMNHFLTQRLNRICPSPLHDPRPLLAGTRKDTRGRRDKISPPTNFYSIISNFDDVIPHSKFDYLVLIICSKCPPAAKTHAFRRLRKSLIVWLIVVCSKSL